MNMRKILFGFYWGHIEQLHLHLFEHIDRSKLTDKLRARATTTPRAKKKHFDEPIWSVCKKSLKAGDLCFLTCFFLHHRIDVDVWMCSFLLFVVVVICLARFSSHCKSARAYYQAMPSILIQQQQQQQQKMKGKKHVLFNTTCFDFPIAIAYIPLQQHRFCSIFIPFCPAFNLYLSAPAPAPASSLTSHVPVFSEQPLT